MTPARSPETVRDADEGVRLDRWLRERLAGLPFSQIQRLVRTGQVRVDGRRARASLRLSPGQRVRIPPLAPSATRASPRARARQDGSALLERILYRDDHFLALDKPAGLAVQGGSGVARHLDGMLDALRFDAEDRPRLVHRLDRDTTGVLLLARSRKAAQHCARLFRQGFAEKTYWALVSGVPKPRSGEMQGQMRKTASRGGRRMAQRPGGRDARTVYRTRAAGGGVSWLELRPLTGRTHQLRVHCADMGCPILGDAKYGEGDAAAPLQLHAREIAVPDLEGLTLRIEAPLPESMRQAFDRAGFAAPPARMAPGLPERRGGAGPGR